MRKKNNAAIAEFILCFGAIVFGIITNGGVKAALSLLHFPSFIVTVGGAVFAVLMTADSFEDFFQVIKSFGTAFKKQSVSVYELAENIFDFSETARREGLLALEEKSELCTVHKCVRDICKCVRAIRKSYKNMLRCGCNCEQSVL